MSLRDYSGNLPFNRQLCTWAPQTAGLLGGHESLRKVCVLGPAGQVKPRPANPGASRQVLGQSVLDSSLCATARVKLLVKPKEN